MNRKKLTLNQQTKRWELSVDNKPELFMSFSSRKEAMIMAVQLFYLWEGE